MQTKLNLDYRRLFQATVVSLCWCGFFFGAAYAGYLLLSAIFWNAAVFSSLFGLAVAVGVFLLYDGSSFQWDNYPRVVIKIGKEAPEDEEKDDE